MMGRVVYAKIHIPLPFRRNQKIKGKGTSNGGGSKRDNSGSVELHLYSPTLFDSQNIQSAYPQYNQPIYIISTSKV
ncbi:MAG: hypothetical protein EZS28_049643 [Streblomastix strix]|uniref:Uncharacterized protein n=1 Tax=Streblomastix strix TaxID=222440 RepID=A0A5J4TBA4_9EUKA|nr:MAG: hypothetical protein EZS28_049643 [Streblomastix strix]